MHLLLPIRSIITYKIYCLQCPETFKFCLNHWQTHFNLKLSNGTLLWKISNMILPVKNIVEEFYHDTSRFNNINQSIVIKYRTNYSIATINCSHLDKKWFFILFHALPMTVNFCKLRCLLKGLQVTFEYLQAEVNLREFKNVKQVGKNTYSLFNFLNWLNWKLVRNLNKEWSLHEKYINKTLQSNDKSMSKYYYSIVYGHYLIVIINRAFYVAVFNVL